MCVSKAALSQSWSCHTATFLCLLLGFASCLLYGCPVPITQPQSLLSSVILNLFCDLQLIRRIDVPVRDIRWSDSGELVAIVSESSFYILRLDNQAVDSFLASGEEAEDDGFQDAFELLNEVSERVRTGVHTPGRMPPFTPVILDEACGLLMKLVDFSWQLQTRADQLGDVKSNCRQEQMGAGFVAQCNEQNIMPEQQHPMPSIERKAMSCR